MAHPNRVPLAIAALKELELRHEELGRVHLRPGSPNALDRLLNVEAVSRHEISRDESRRPRDAGLAVNEDGPLVASEGRTDKLGGWDKVLDDVGLVGVVDGDAVEVYTRGGIVLLSHCNEGTLEGKDDQEARGGEDLLAETTQTMFRFCSRL